eukprot:scaffold130564_cov21-Tisochrysis_lutea.AAC.1
MNSSLRRANRKREQLGEETQVPETSTPPTARLITVLTGLSPRLAKRAIRRLRPHGPVPKNCKTQ